MSELFHNIHFWLIISFIIAFTFLIKKTYKIVDALLVNKVKDVVSEIDNSVNVLNESLSLLDEATVERSSIEKKLTEDSIKTKKDDDSYYEKYIADLNTRAKSNKESFDNYIDIQYKLSIINHGKNIVHKSLASVLDHIESNIDNTKHSQLIDDSIEDFIKKI